MLEKIGLGGGCHWCTEAVFQSLKGVESVDSGWICSYGEHCSESEAVVVHFDPEQIPLSVLLEIHVLTHSSAANHSMRHKYRSAVYVFSETQAKHLTALLAELSSQQEDDLITLVLPHRSFRDVGDAYKNYYLTDSQRPFCVNIIEPKLQKVVESHREYVDLTRLT